MRAGPKVLRIVSLSLASGLTMFFLAEVLAQNVSNWSTPVNLGSTTINTASAEQ